jgi:hypothetical protein|tara:strand:- start:599 stop:817 length:219 start_codon:yes stop_codon:yes gene_type:complete
MTFLADELVIEAEFSIECAISTCRRYKADVAIMPDLAVIEYSKVQDHETPLEIIRYSEVVKFDPCDDAPQIH